ncbi:MAG: hypothetical protein Q9175_005477 [Cornicularia normoerica]
MLGVQSFVAQRQQGQPNPSRQVLGAQHRVPIPTTKLENPKQKPSLQKPNPNLPAGSPVAGPNTQLSRQKSAETSAVQDGFDTDAEYFDETTPMSVGGSTRGHHGEEDDRSPISSQYGPDAANDVSSGAQISFPRGQEQPYLVQESMQRDADASVEGEEEEEGSEGKSADEKGDEESDEEDLVRDGILQDLNSPGFSQYLHGKTSHTTQAAFQPFTVAPVVHSSLGLRNAIQHSQQPANQFTSRGKSINGGAVDPGANFQRANTQAHVRAMKQTSAVPFQTLQGTSLEQPSIPALQAAQHHKVSDHHEPNQHLSAISHQTLRPISRARLGVAQGRVSTNVQYQANEETPLSMQNGTVDLCDDDTSVDWEPNVERRHDRRITASVDSPQTRKRARDLDFSPDHLSSMTFQQLSNEPFSLASDTPRTSIPREFSSRTLAAKMDYILEKLKYDEAKLVQRRAFFSSLSIEQYEECANLMIRRFSDIMSEFTDARQQRRRVAKDFEEEVAKREKCVRGKTTVVDKDLGRLKRGGEEVVRGAAL